MTLDLAKVSPQIRQMGQRLLERREQLEQRLEQARETLQTWSDRWEELRQIAERRERSQRLASPREPLLTAVDCPAVPADHAVLATDGSQIEPDRHGVSEYYLLNIGWALLRYGSQPQAELTSQPTLAYEQEDLFIYDDEQRRRVPVQGSHLAALRAVRELERAAELAERPLDLPLVTLQDGTLLLWVLEERPEDFLREAFLTPYCAALRRCQELDRPLASYISRPRSTEVSALLRAATCQGNHLSRASCGQRGERQCAFDGLYDRSLFTHLQLGQRSALFAVTLHARLERYYAGQRIHFFYVNVGSELARVEVPEWIAGDAGRLALVHGVVVDQCERGQGYPAVLTRAHEQAIVRSGDRQMVRLLLESMFARQGLRASLSEKEAAKRLRAV